MAKRLPKIICKISAKGFLMKSSDPHLRGYKICATILTLEEAVNGRLIGESNI